mmetsp:Transcript_58981/g.68936  ORF Transcript_58981/g.68936 Transcript_58981/m.68936 type:complete len:83 (+) Transcript_58981:191-439(+)
MGEGNRGLSNGHRATESTPPKQRTEQYRMGGDKHGWYETHTLAQIVTQENGDGFSTKQNASLVRARVVLNGWGVFPPPRKTE